MITGFAISKSKNSISIFYFYVQFIGKCSPEISVVEQ